MADADLALINKVELRIALTQDDALFENALNLYLAPLLLKLGSEHGPVRSAILSILRNLIPRITAARDVKLPVEALLEQAKRPKVSIDADSSQVRLYSLLFVSRGVDRLSIQDKNKLIPLLIEGISTHSLTVSSRLFNVLGKVLEGWRAPDNESVEYAEMEKSLHLDANPQDAIFLAKKIAKFFILLPSDSVTPMLYHGLSIDDHAFFSLHAGVVFKSPNELTELKLRYLQLLKSGGFKDMVLALPYMIASADDSSALNSPASTLFKKLTLNVDDEEFVNDCVQLFLGGDGVPPCTPKLQERILVLLSKSSIVGKHPQIDEITLRGLESDNAKSKSAGLYFAKWVTMLNASNGSSASSSLNSSVALQLKSSILGEGWPVADVPKGANYATFLTQRALKYETLGSILKQSSELSVNDFSYIEFLFKSLEGEVSDVRSSIQDALSGLAIHLPSLSPESKLKIKQYAAEYLTYQDTTSVGGGSSNENLQACRYMIVKYLNFTFPFADAEARMFNILGSYKHNRLDTVEESNHGLHPHWFNIVQSANTTQFKSSKELLGQQSAGVQFPLFDDMVCAFNSHFNDVNRNRLPTILKTLGKAVVFVFRTFVMEAVNKANTVIVPDEQWDLRLDKAVETDSVVQKLLVDKCSCSDRFSTFIKLVLRIFLDQFSGGSGINPNINYGTTLSTLLHIAPTNVIGDLTTTVPLFVDVFEGGLVSGETASIACESFAIVASHPNVDNDSIQAILNSAMEGSSRNLQQIRTLSVGYLIGRLYLRARATNIVSVSFLKSYLDFLLEQKSPAWSSIVWECVIQISMFGALNSPDFADYVTKFIDLVEDGVKKSDERAMNALACLTLSLTKDNDNTLNKCENLAYKTHISKHLEFTFTVGEAFLIMAAGWQSKALQKNLDIQGTKIEYFEPDISRLPLILSTVLAACANTKPALRKSACIWLLSLAQFCGHLQPVKDKAREMHIAFTIFLADKDELIQESASRGLSIVYEMGDVELKEVLVKGLLKSFTDSNASSIYTSGSVEEDTQLFEPHILKTGEGSVSTYKDVLNLASEVGDPSLVYKFMSLAKNSVLWSSRKGMAFGLGSILSKTSLNNLFSTNQQLTNRLIPRLYRYRYDPNTSVSTAMNDIWNSLVPNNSDTINEHFDIILEELLKGMGNKEWRVRQASTTALNDLLQVSTLESYGDKLEEIWQMSFRAMDDIKDSVRKEGNKLTKSLSTILLRTIDAKYSSSSPIKAEKVLKDLIPFLLGPRGILSEAEDVKNFSIKTITKICKDGGAFVRPFIPDLIENFVQLMSTLEPEAINYLLLNADKYNISPTELDARRLQAVGSSPIMQTIEKMLDNLADTDMDTFIKKLGNSIKKSVGLPSKVCGSKILVTLVTDHLELSKPYGDRFLKIALSQLKDRNEAVSSTYATACGFLCRIASIESVESFAELINRYYFDHENYEDSRWRLIAAVASFSVATYSGDKFQSMTGVFLPLAFIGKHDVDPEVAKTFDKMWIEFGNNSTIRLYLPELLDFYERHLQSPRFETRRALATSIGELSLVVTGGKGGVSSTAIENLSDNDKKQLLHLMSLLIVACKGKTWEGKEKVLRTLTEFTINAKSLVVTDHLVTSEVTKTLITEARRRNKQYQKQAVKCLGLYIAEYTTQEQAVEVYVEVMRKILRLYKSEDSDDMDTDSSDDDHDESRKRFKGESKAKMLAMEKERGEFIDNISLAYFDRPIDLSQQVLALYCDAAEHFLTQSDIDLTWASDIMFCTSMSHLLGLMKEEERPEATVSLFSIWNLLKKRCLVSHAIENVRLQFIKLTVSFMNYSKSEQIQAEIRKDLSEFKSFEKSSKVLKQLADKNL